MRTKKRQRTSFRRPITPPWELGQIPLNDNDNEETSSEEDGDLEAPILMVERNFCLKRFLEALDVQQGMKSLDVLQNALLKKAVDLMENNLVSKMYVRKFQKLSENREDRQSIVGSRE